MDSVSIVGVGRLGGAFAVALARAGFTIHDLVFRETCVPEAVLAAVNGSARAVPLGELGEFRSSAVLITTPDDTIAAAARTLAVHKGNLSVALHASGALSSAALAPLASAGIAVGSIHPLVSVSDPLNGSAAFQGSYFCVEGDELALRFGRSVIDKLGGIGFSIDSGLKPLYHAAAVMSAGHMVALFDTAVEVLRQCGPDAETARSALLTLMRSTVDNLECQDIDSSLTGPFSRADLATVRLHLDALERSVAEEYRRIYIELGLRSLEIARRSRRDAGSIDHIREELLLAWARAR